ncbi:MAG TPA: hypothetical protein VH639_09635 [Bryobacteraceae bacterium]
MKKITKLGIVFCLAGVFSFGATWRGAKLLDASCYDQNGKVRHVGSMCAPTESTTNFAMETRMGHIYKLDSLSNQKAEQAVQNGVVRANGHGDFRAKVTGKREGNGFVNISSITHGSRGEY